jgi:uncharacterized phage infection (PIP) family protein YhgE
MPILLAQQMDGLNQTLQTLEDIGNIESIPGALLLMGVLLFLGIVVIAFIFMRVMNAQLKAFEQYTTSQQKAAEAAQSNYIVERDVTGARIERLVEKTDSINQVIEGYHTTLLELTSQLGQNAQYLAETAKALMTLEKRVLDGETMAIERWESFELTGKELKNNMNELGNGNKQILAELSSIREELRRVATSVETKRAEDTEELKRIADSVELAMANLIVAVDKLTHPAHSEPSSGEADATE